MNGFDELCVNVANEKVEAFFQNSIFRRFSDGTTMDEESCIAENPSNGKLIEVLSGRPNGILSVLEDECKFPKV
jgi:myosin heavy subunit